MNSIISNDRRCFMCGRYDCLERHHVFGAYNRTHSEEDGLWVWLCHWCHNEPPYGVHFNKDNMTKLRQIGQRAYEKHIGNDFMERYGRNYL